MMALSYLDPISPYSSCFCFFSGSFPAQVKKTAKHRFVYFPQ